MGAWLAACGGCHLGAQVGAHLEGIRLRHDERPMEKGKLDARRAHVLVVDGLSGSVVVHVDDGHRVDETLLAAASTALAASAASAAEVCEEA